MGSILFKPTYNGHTFAFKLTKEEVSILGSSDVILISFPSTDDGEVRSHKLNVFGRVGAEHISKGAICILENY